MTATISAPGAAARKRLNHRLEELCVDRGFCSRLSAGDLLPGRDAPSARDFAEAVLRE